MKNILVFRACSDEIMKSLFQEIKAQDCQCKIYCLIQPLCIERYQALYNDIIFINSGMDIFRYEQMDFGLLRSIKIDDIYVPSSSPYFHNYEDIFFIIDKLQYKKMVLYDCYGRKRFIKYKNHVQKRIQFMTSKLSFGMFTGIYKIKNMLRGSE